MSRSRHSRARSQGGTRILERRSWCSLAAGGLLLSTASSNAHSVEASDVVQQLVVGTPAGASPMSGVDAARRHQAGFQFTKPMTVSWRARLTGPVTVDPVVDETARAVVVHERGTLSQLDRKGKLQWSLRLGDAGPSTGPALLSDGTRVVLNHENELLRISPAGQVLSATRTALRGKAVPLLPLDDGGLAIAVERSLLRLDHRGEPVAAAQADTGVRVLLQSKSAVLAVTTPGVVYQFRGTGALTEKARFNYPIATSALWGDKLYAITTYHQLLSLDLQTGTIEVVHTSPAPKSLRPWLAIGGRAVYVATADATVRSFSATGQEVLHSVLTGQSPGIGRARQLSGGPLALADAANGLALAHPGSELRVLEDDGSHYRVTGGACLSPAALTPLSSKSILLACRNGELIAVTTGAGTVSDSATH